MNETLPLYWLPEDAVAVKVAETFEALAEVAIRILERMRAEHSGREIIEICGPISTGGLGSTAENLRIFAEAIRVLRAEGLVVLDQGPFETHMGRIARLRGHVGYCTELLEVFYGRLFRSGHVHRGLFLPDWEHYRGWSHSTGARWERAQMVALGIPVEEYPLHLFARVMKRVPAAD